jgi:hypothetical protein
MRYPHHEVTAPESVLRRHLEEGAELLRSARPTSLEGVGELVSADFEHLRWFELPPDCLAGSSGCSA